MIIKSGDYVESLHGNVGVVKTVGKTVPVDGKEQFSFDWEITRPSIGSGGRGFFAGSESDLWRHYRQIGMYHNPFQKERMTKQRMTKQRIEPIEFGKIEKARATKVTISTDGDVKTERGEFDILKRTKLTVTDLAVKINEIINYLNAEEC
nr:MAG TPA: hypothetical protein [Caudoviricetes sp.]